VTDVPGFQSGVATIEINKRYGCAVRADGSAGCWGSGSQGILPDGVLTSGVQSVASGYEHACALLSDATVKCWGKNDTGQLGNGTQLDSGSPVSVIGVSGASAIAAGLNHSCAIVSGGVLCWGQGYGTTALSVSGLASGVASMSTSYTHSCALLTSGAVKCWGSNVFGQIGDGLACGGQCANPVTPAGLASGVSGISAGLFHTCAVLNSGAAKCWGFNGGGQLGAGITQNKTTPVDVVTNAAKPTPTSTPCPGSCPTATSTPSGPPLTGIDWSIGIDTNGDGHVDCSTEGTDAGACTAVLGGSFVLVERLDALAQDFNAYTGFDAYVEFSGVNATGAFSTHWPECNSPANAFGSGWAAVGCNIFAGIYTSSYVGDMVTLEFTCGASGAITMAHGSGDTGLIDQQGTYYREGDPSTETLSVNCIDPYLDADGDGCTNGQELSADQTDGGQRDPYNPWDYFEPTGNGLNRIDDVVVVLQQYFEDNPQPGYTMTTDRSFLGPNLWSLGPPDGIQRIDDVIDSLAQYFHDCA
jgi:hypothetical protein